MTLRKVKNKVVVLSLQIQIFLFGPFCIKCFSTVYSYLMILLLGLRLCHIPYFGLMLLLVHSLILIKMHLVVLIIFSMCISFGVFGFRRSCQICIQCLHLEARAPAMLWHRLNNFFATTMKMAKQWTRQKKTSKEN